VALCQELEYQFQCEFLVQLNAESYIRYEMRQSPGWSITSSLLLSRATSAIFPTKNHVKLFSREHRKFDFPGLTLRTGARIKPSVSSSATVDRSSHVFSIVVCHIMQ
jgi:hypothetical protein